MIDPAVAKVPVHLALMAAESVAFLPPNKSPTKEDHSKYGANFDFLDVSAEWLPYIGVTGLWSLHLLEITAILFQAYPSPLSSSILSLLFVGSTSSYNLAPSPLFALGALLLISGAAIRKACYVHLGRLFTFQLSVLKEHKLITSGPYAIVRHPSYTGLLLAVTGLVCVHLVPGAYVAQCGLMDVVWGRVLIALGVSLGMYVQMQAVARTGREDAVMKAEFGQAWEEWARKTPCRLIPGVY